MASAWQYVKVTGHVIPAGHQYQQRQHSEGLPLGSRLSSYTSAASHNATPKAAAAECISWNNSLDGSASYATAQVSLHCMHASLTDSVLMKKRSCCANGGGMTGAGVSCWQRSSIVATIAFLPLPASGA